MSVLIGRALQLMGMILLPVGLLIGVLRDNVRLEVNLLFFGGFCFILGWLMARRRE
jgi:hypothetical protein